MWEVEGAGLLWGWVRGPGARRGAQSGCICITRPSFCVTAATATPIERPASGWGVRLGCTSVRVDVWGCLALRESGGGEVG